MSASLQTTRLSPSSKERLIAEARRRGISHRLARTNRDDLSISFDDLWIRHKDPDQGVVRLEPNEVQRLYLDAICPGWTYHDYRVRGLRELILKFRQPGFSTIIEALIFVNVYNT